MKNTITTAALVATFNASQWTARKLDKKITDEVNTNHNASTDAGRYNKLLVAKEFTEPVSKIVNEARTFHYENTLCWGDNGDRLLPTENYMDYTQRMAALESDFNDAVAKFMANYDDVITDAKRRLNGMFNPLDYPSRTEIEQKFRFSVRFFPVPENDIRVSLPAKEVSRLKAEMEKEVESRINEAVGNIWERIGKQLHHMAAKLSDAEAIFRDSLFGNLNELVELLPKLNVTKDANVAKAINDMKKLVANPDAVRSDAKLREKKAKEVADVLKKFKGFIN